MRIVKPEEIGIGEREAIAAAIREAGKLKENDRTKILLALQNIAEATARAARKRQSNRRTEPLRRRLVGAQVPLELADRVKECAEMLGLSVYRFVSDSLENACCEVQGRKTGHPRPRSTGSLSAPSLRETWAQNVEASPPGVTDCPTEGKTEADLQNR